MKTHHRTLALASLLLAGSFAGPAAAADECVAITVAGALSDTIFVDGFESQDTSAWSAPSLTSFDLAATDDLVAEITLDAAISGDHLLELRWKLADGQLYQSVAVPVTIGALAAGAKRTVAGYPFPVEVAAARPSRNPSAPAGANAVESSLPVAGTLIVETGLTGVWHLEAYFDDAESPCGAAYDFRLTP